MKKFFLPKAIKPSVKKIIAAALALVPTLCLALFSCNDPAKNTLLDQVKAKGQITIMLEGNWEPWSYHDENGDLVGFDVEVAQTLCERLGVKAKIIETQWEQIFPALERRECDIVVDGVEITRDRVKRFYFTQPYAYDRTAIIVRSNNNNINSFEDLKGRTSGNKLEIGKRAGRRIRFYVRLTS